MESGNVRIRVRAGVNEIEIEAPVAAAKEAVELIGQVMQNLPFVEAYPQKSRALERVAEEAGHVLTTPAGVTAQQVFPEIRVDKDDSLTDVITKMFRDPWGRQPRKLSEVREALESYGLIYPKQSVAVALLRLAQSGRLRRFKGEGREFVYTASTVLAMEGAPSRETGQRSEKTISVEEPT